MTLKWNSSDLDDLIKSYRAGESAVSLGKRYGVSHTAVMRLLRRKLPDYRHATGKWEPPDLSALVDSYRSGSSIKSLSERYGVSRRTITRYVQDLPDYRSHGDANRLMATERTPEQRTAWTAAARAARRGQVDGPRVRNRRALTRQHQTCFIGRGEQELIGWLNSRGVVTQPQFPVDGYNIDIAVPPVAVELITSLGNPLRRARIQKRVENLTNAGWHVLCVWLPRAGTLVEEATDQVIAFIEATKRDPSPIGQCRVIWGASQDMIGSRDPNKMACVPTAIRPDDPFG